MSAAVERKLRHETPQGHPCSKTDASWHPLMKQTQVTACHNPPDPSNLMFWISAPGWARFETASRDVG